MALRDAPRRRLDSLLSLIDDFDREITATTKEIDQQAKADERVALLCQIRGVGRYTAMLIIRDRRHPTVPDRPAPMRVGGADPDGSPLRQQSPAGTDLQTRLAPVALGADRTGGGPLREQYERIAKRRGAKVAKLAIARQILTLSYYGPRDGEIRRLKTPAPASSIEVLATA